MVSKKETIKMKINTDTPIIQSVNDVDVYKGTMGQVAHSLHPFNKVGFGFTNRKNNISLPSIIPIEALKEQLDHLQTLCLTRDEYQYMGGIQLPVARRPMFGKSYLDFLSKPFMPEINVEIVQIDGIDQFKIESYGNWPNVSPVETMILSVVNELFYQYSNIDHSAAMKEGERRLLEKIKLFKQNLLATFIEFGTRRRFSGAWQEHVTKILAQELLGTMIGTSNLNLARKLSLTPVGTMAHEMDMVYQGIYWDHDNKAGTFISHDYVMRDWWNYYGVDLSIALTDTYGSDYFFRRLTDQQVRDWKGGRHDSGSTSEWALKLIKRIEQAGVDPKTKLGLYSDGLTAKVWTDLFNFVDGRFITSGGIGTHLTNDMGLSTLSIVMKAIFSNGHGTVKLSDNLAKAQGNLENIERAKRFVGYTNTNYETCEV